MWISVLLQAPYVDGFHAVCCIRCQQSKQLSYFTTTIRMIVNCRFIRYTIVYSEELPTLLKFDIVHIQDGMDPVFLQNIQKDGVILYAAEG